MMADLPSSVPVHLLIIHPETAIGGAETVLGYFLPALAARSFQVTLAIADSPLKAVVPRTAHTIIIPDCVRFSFQNLGRQIIRLNRYHKEHSFDIVHGWAARDWELASLVAGMWRKPAVGTLHDHPAADYIRRRRRLLMRLAAAWGLRRIVCVSDAVRRACEATGYRQERLLTIHNGLPGVELAAERPALQPKFRIGYLGALTAGKGIEDLLAIMDRVPAQTSVEWQLDLAGAPVTSDDATWLEQLKKRYAQRPWWPRVSWLGWVDRPSAFLGSVDLLAFTSSSFDSLPTVLLEAAWAGTPVLASAVGGAPEIVEHGLTGWLFTPGDRAEASSILIQLLTDRFLLARTGIAARKRAAAKFSVQKMVEAYDNLYLSLTQNG
jgi:glycosyltransferase involved in cell wall biosynthesis